VQQSIIAEIKVYAHKKIIVQMKDMKQAVKILRHDVKNKPHYAGFM